MAGTSATGRVSAINVALGLAAAIGMIIVAGYSAFGAFWFLVSAIALSRRTRRAKR